MADESDKVQIILEAVERAKATIDATLKDLDRLDKANDAGAAASGRAAKGVKDHETALGKLKLGGIAAVAALTLVVEKALEVGGAMIQAAEKIIEANAAMFRAAESAEQTVEAYSKLAFSAKLAKVGQEDLSISLRRLAVAMTEARDPSSAAAQTFNQLGIATKGLENRKPTEVLLELADTFSKHTGAAEKSAAATALLGRGSREMVNFLNQGSGAIKQQGTEAERLGFVLSTEAGRAAEEFEQKSTILKATLQGLFTNAITPLLPILQQLANQLLELAKDKQLVITVTSALFATFATLAQIATGVYVVMRVLGIVLGQGVALALALVQTRVNEVTNLFNIFREGISRLILRMVDLVSAFAGLGTIISKFISGDFEGAADAANDTFQNLRKTVAGIGADVKTVFSQAAGEVQKASQQIDDNLVGITTNALKEIGTVVDGAGKVFNAVQLKTGGAIGGTGTAGAEGGTKTPLQQKSNAAEVAATRDKLAQLNAEAKAAGLKAEADFAELQHREQAAFEKRMDAEKLTRQAAIFAEEKENEVRLKAIDSLVATDQERNALIQSNYELHQNKLSEIAKTGVAERTRLEKAHQNAQLQIWSQSLAVGATFFDSLANLAKLYGKKGFAVYQGLAIASAVMGTASGAINAYQSAAAIPYVGFILAPIAAAAAVAAGAAQIAAIESQHFAEGGIVPGAPSAVDNRIAHVATGEMIVSAGSTQNLIRQVGMGGIGALLAGRMPWNGFSGGPAPRPLSGNAFATGGLVGAGIRGPNASDAVDVSIGFLNGRNAMRDFAQREGFNILIDQMQRRGNAVVS